MEYEKEFDLIKEILYPNLGNTFWGFAGGEYTWRIKPYTPMMMRSMAIMYDVAETIKECSDEIGRL